MATDVLWPEADGDASINNLNQTVYQLRRYLDPGFRQGESPEYVISSADQLALNRDLVHTDVALIRGLPESLTGMKSRDAHAAAREAIALIEGEFLADLRYESWVTPLQLNVHNDVRSRLLPIAQRQDSSLGPQLPIDAATALVCIDPYDEAATLALAECLADSGKRIAARGLLVRYVDRVRSELDEEPSSTFVESAGRLVGQA
jgi:DNA-binding SARP family transcriptional activator